MLDGGEMFTAEVTLNLTTLVVSPVDGNSNGVPDCEE
jgi:hypothetical protein